MTVLSETARAWVDVDLDALVANARTLIAACGTRLLPMVKANGYGLGATRVARALEALDPWGYGVATVEEGLALTARQIGEAEVQRAQLYHRMREFMERHEFLLIPTVQVPPFDVTQPYVTEINGTKLPTYIDWMRSCSDITVTALPAISVPAGFTEDGLPVGLQIVGRHQDEWGVLQLAHAFEGATGFYRRRPSVAE